MSELRGLGSTEMVRLLAGITSYQLQDGNLLVTKINRPATLHTWAELQGPFPP